MTKRMWVCKVTSVQSVDIVCSENIWKFASALRWHGKFINLCSVHTVIRWHADLAVTVIYNSFNFFPFLFCFHSLLVLRDWFFFSPSFIFSVSPFVSLSHCINQILESVSHIHQHDIVHRDLKVSHAVVMETCAESRARHQMTPIPLEPPSLGNWVAWHVLTQDCNAKRHFTALENNSSGLFPAPPFFFFSSAMFCLSTSESWHQGVVDRYHMTNHNSRKKTSMHKGQIYRLWFIIETGSSIRFSTCCVCFLTPCISTVHLAPLFAH